MPSRMLREKARKFYKELETAYNLLNPNKTKRDEVKSFVTICKKIWELSGDPFSKIYCCYLDVLEKSADKILKLQEKLVDAQIDDIFNNNEITFKLRVAHERKRDLEEFYGNLPDILKSFKVDLANAVKDVKDIHHIRPMA